MQKTIQAQTKYNEQVNKIKKLYRVQYVANCDLYALVGNFEILGLGNFLDYKKEEPKYRGSYNPDIRTFNAVRVLCINFKELGEHFDPFFKTVTGYNKTSGYENHVTFNDGDYFLNDKVILCLTDEQRENLAQCYQRREQFRNEWDAFHKEVKPRMKYENLGEQFEIGETVADYFLNCMPPFYGRGCFLMGEPCSSTPEGETIYYCFRKAGRSHTIEYNTVSACK